MLNIFQNWIFDCKSCYEELLNRQCFDFGLMYIFTLFSLKVQVVVPKVDALSMSFHQLFILNLARKSNVIYGHCLIIVFC